MMRVRKLWDVGLSLKDLIVFGALKLDLRCDIRERHWSMATFPKLDLHVVRKFCSRRTPALINASFHFYRKFVDDLWAIHCKVLCLLEILFQVKQLKPRFRIWFRFGPGGAPTAGVRAEAKFVVPFANGKGTIDGVVNSRRSYLWAVRVFEKGKPTEAIRTGIGRQRNSDRLRNGCE